MMMKRFSALLLALSMGAISLFADPALPPTVNVTLLFQAPGGDTIGNTPTIRIRPHVPFTINASDGRRWQIPYYWTTFNVTDTSGSQVVTIHANMVGVSENVTYTPDPITYYDYEWIGKGSGQGTYRGKIQVPCCDPVDWGDVTVPDETEGSIRHLLKDGDAMIGPLTLAQTLIFEDIAQPGDPLAGTVYMDTATPSKLWFWDGSEWLELSRQSITAEQVLAGSGISVGLEGDSVRITNTGVLSAQGQGGIVINGTSGSPQTGTVTVSQTYGDAQNTAIEGNNPRVPSQDENDALVGTNGAPSSTNKFVTNTDPRNTDARTPTGHASSHQHGGSDQVGTATPGANAIVKADSDGKVGEGWIDDADIDHNSTGSTQGGQSGQKYHLSSAEHSGLTGGGNTTTHYHDADRARAVHTGTQTRSTISDFAHKATHEDGGSDEMSVAGLGGLLADAQTPLSHTHTLSGGLAGTTASASVTAVQGSPADYPTTPDTWQVGKAYFWDGNSLAILYPDWAWLTNVPSTFTPSSHTHVEADITNLAHRGANLPLVIDTNNVSLKFKTATGLDVDIYTGELYLDSTATTPSWANIQGKPVTFPPDSHSHTWAEVSKSGSNLTDIATRNHNDLQNLDAGDYKHLTAATFTDLTDGSQSTLHYHPVLSPMAISSGSVSFTYAIAFKLSTGLFDLDFGGGPGQAAEATDARFFTLLQKTDLTDGGLTELHGHHVASPLNGAGTSGNPFDIGLNSPLSDASGNVSMGFDGDSFTVAGGNLDLVFGTEPSDMDKPVESSDSRILTSAQKADLTDGGDASGSHIHNLSGGLAGTTANASVTTVQGIPIDYPLTPDQIAAGKMLRLDGSGHFVIVDAMEVEDEGVAKGAIDSFNVSSSVAALVVAARKATISIHSPIWSNQGSQSGYGTTVDVTSPTASVTNVGDAATLTIPAPTIYDADGDTHGFLKGIKVESGAADVDGNGVLTLASGAGSVTSVNAGTGINVTGPPTDPIISLNQPWKADSSSFGTGSTLNFIGFGLDLDDDQLNITANVSTASPLSGSGSAASPIDIGLNVPLTDSSGNVSLGYSEPGLIISSGNLTLDFGDIEPGKPLESNSSRVPLQAENDALQGTNGTPSGANRYVTDSDPRNANARTPTAHGASHADGTDSIPLGDGLEYDSNTLRVDLGSGATQAAPGNHTHGYGDLFGPSSSTHRALSAFDGTTGKLVLNTLVTLNAGGELDGIVSLDADFSISSPDFVDETASTTVTSINITNQAPGDIITLQAAGWGRKAAGADGTVLNIVAGEPDYTAIGGDLSGTIGNLQLGTGVVGTGEISNGSVAFADMANIATDSLIGRDTAGSGVPEAITLDTDLALNGSGVLGVVDANIVIPRSQLSSVTTDSLVGRDTAGTGNAETITLGTDLALNGSQVLGVVDANLTIDSPQISPIATNTLLGRDTAGSGAVEEITLDTDLTFTSNVLGVVDANIVIPRSQLSSVTTDSLVGRDTAGTGNAETITLGSTLSLNGSQVLGVATGGITANEIATDAVDAAEIKASAVGTSEINDGTVAFADMANIATDSLIGRDTAGSGVPEAITLASDLAMSSGVLGVVDANLTIDSPQISPIATNTLLGRDTAGSGAAEEITLASAFTLASQVLTTNINTARLWGRTTASAGAIEEIAMGSGVTLSAGTLSATGKIAQVRIGTSTSSGSTTDTLGDNTNIPQVGDGAEATEVTITPTNASSTLVIFGNLSAGTVSPFEICTAVFQDATANADAAWLHNDDGGGLMNTFFFAYSESAASTSSRTYNLRYGPGGGGTQAVYVNKTSSEETLSTAGPITFICVVEVLP